MQPRSSFPRQCYFLIVQQLVLSPVVYSESLIDHTSHWLPPHHPGLRALLLRRSSSHWCGNNRLLRPGVSSGNQKKSTRTAVSPLWFRPGGWIQHPRWHVDAYCKSFIIYMSLLFMHEKSVEAESSASAQRFSFRLVWSALSEGFSSRTVIIPPGGNPAMSDYC